MRRWQPMDLPIFGSGEENAAAPLASDPATGERMENVLLTGPGTVEQVPDWRLIDTCKNLAGTPLEGHAVCGIFPFATQGGAGAASAGVALSFNTTDNKIYLHQLGEDGTILRTFTAYASYSQNQPPQITGFEWFGKFIYCAYDRDVAANRVGLGIFDPTTTGTITNPTYELVAGGTGASVLKFRGICKHRGGTVLGWGYQDEESGNVDLPATVRYAKYTQADLSALASWKEDTTEISGGKFVCGTLGLPVVAGASAGQYTVLGKETEIFVLDGDYGSQFYLRQIGSAHGPSSTVGMTSTGPLAVWMSDVGPMASSGGRPEQLATNRLTRRLRTYYDLTWAWACHDAPRNRVGWALRRLTDWDGVPQTAFWASQLLWWDYEKDQFTIQGAPTTTVFSLGTIKGPGVTLAGPSAVPVFAAATNITATSAQLNWTNGDSSASTILEYKLHSSSTYTVLPTVSPGGVSLTLSGLTASSAYDYRGRHYKNGQYSAYFAVTAFTTSAPSAVATPATFAYTAGGSEVVAGKTYWILHTTWTQTEFASGAQAEVLENTANTLTGASRVQLAAASITSLTRERIESTTPYYYWVRQILADGTVGTELALTGSPIQFNATYLGA